MSTKQGKNDIDFLDERLDVGSFRRYKVKKVRKLESKQIRNSLSLEDGKLRCEEARKLGV